MSLREAPKGIKSKYVKAPNGRIFLNNPRLALLADMSAVDVQGFEDPVPETVDQLNAMIAKGLKKPTKTEADVNEDIFDFSKATKKQIAKKAKENFDFDIEDIDSKDVADVRKEYEFLLATGSGTNDDTGAGSN